MMKRKKKNVGYKGNFSDIQMKLDNKKNHSRKKRTRKK